MSCYMYRLELSCNSQHTSLTVPLLQIPSSERAVASAASTRISSPSLYVASSSQIYSRFLASCYVFFRPGASSATRGCSCSWIRRLCRRAATPVAAHSFASSRGATFFSASEALFTSPGSPLLLLSGASRCGHWKARVLFALSGSASIASAAVPPSAHIASNRPETRVYLAPVRMPTSLRQDRERCQRRY